MRALAHGMQHNWLMHDGIWAIACFYSDGGLVLWFLFRSSYLVA